MGVPGESFVDEVPRHSCVEVDRFHLCDKEHVSEIAGDLEIYSVVLSLKCEKRV